MIPEIDEKKLRTKNKYDKMQYCSKYIDSFIRMPRANYDGVGNSLTKEYLVKLNELFFDYKNKISCVYDCLTTYIFDEHDEHRQAYVGCIITTNKSQASQKRHIRCVKDAVKNTRVTPQLAIILDNYIEHIEARIKYLEEHIIPIQVSITPLAGIYYFCIENGESFSDKMVDFMLPEEMNVYKNRDYDETIDFAQVNETKKNNSQKLHELIASFNNDLKEKDPNTYAKYFTEYENNLNLYLKRKNKKDAEKKARKELKELSVKIKEAENKINIENVIHNMKKAISDTIDSCKANNLSCFDDDFVDTCYARIMSDRCYCIIVVKKNGGGGFLQRISSKKRLITTINPSDIFFHSQAEMEVFTKIIDQEGLAQYYEIISLREYEDKIKTLHKEKLEYCKEYSKREISRYLKDIKNQMEIAKKNNSTDTNRFVKKIANNSEDRFVIMYCSNSGVKFVIHKTFGDSTSRIHKASLFTHDEAVEYAKSLKGVSDPRMTYHIVNIGKYFKPSVE